MIANFNNKNTTKTSYWLYYHFLTMNLILNKKGTARYM